MIADDTILVDAYSQIFRAFYAVADLSNRDGFPTNALFAFSRMLLQLERDFPARRGAMFFDCGKPAFRLALAPTYKANRPPMPEKLQMQMPVLAELIDAFGWTRCVCENFEADDLIGAAARAIHTGSIYIVSADKDLCQLIDERTVMLIPARTGGGFEPRDTTAVQEKFAVAPAQIIDYLALLGDNSDNIDGVPGIGAKTAVKLLAEVGTLQQAFENPTRISNEKLRERLLAHKPLALRNRELVRLRCDWPSSLPPPETLRRRTADWAQVRAIAERYELHSLLKALPDAPTAPLPADDLFASPVTPPAPPSPATPLRQDDLFGN